MAFSKDSGSQTSETSQPPPGNPDDAIRLRVETAVYPLEAIYRACYRFTDKYYLWLTAVPSDNSVAIEIEIASKQGHLDASIVRGEFGNTLIDEALRHTIALETGSIRDALVTAALREAFAPHGAPDVSPPSC